MLTLTRKVGEAIRIGDDVTIVVKEIRKNQVRISIVAPREVKIYREEVYENILAERRAAEDEDGDDANREADDEAAAPPPKRSRRPRARRDKNGGSGGAPKGDEEAAG